jgi:hypothetical protein
MSTYHFPRVYNSAGSCGCTIILTPSAAQRLRGQFHSSFADRERFEETKDIGKRDVVSSSGDEIAVVAAKVLANGWVAAFLNYEPDQQSTYRLDLMFPPHEVVAIVSDAMVGVSGRHGERIGDDGDGNVRSLAERVGAERDRRAQAWLADDQQ